MSEDDNWDNGEEDDWTDDEWGEDEGWGEEEDWSLSPASISCFVETR